MKSIQFPLNMSVAEKPQALSRPKPFVHEGQHPVLHQGDVRSKVPRPQGPSSLTRLSHAIVKVCII